MTPWLDDQKSLKVLKKIHSCEKSYKCLRSCKKSLKNSFDFVNKVADNHIDHRSPHHFPHFCFLNIKTSNYWNHIIGLVNYSNICWIKLDFVHLTSSIKISSFAWLFSPLQSFLEIFPNLFLITENDCRA